ncbi:MAG: hypothetical protein M1438_01505 [Deltaproteobacteria bacterium]|nr:hypothetical protein [Deltaproteobacteria bacterium]
MPRPLKILLAMVLLISCVAPAWPQMAPPPPPGVAPLPPPVPPGVAPAWVVAPTSPKVFYAPNLPSDLFLLHKRYYYYYAGAWYQSKHLLGPWHPVRKPHPALYRIDRSLFKTPPAW